MDNFKKLWNVLVEATTAPTLPKTKPTPTRTPSQPTPTRHPFLPSPDRKVNPKPKGSFKQMIVANRNNPDVVLFFHKRGIDLKSLIGEAYDSSHIVPQDYPNYVADDGEVMRSLNQDTDLDTVLPKLKEDDRKYLITVCSETYKTMVDKLAREMGITVAELAEDYPHYSSLGMLSGRYLHKILSTQRGKESYLEKLAIDVVLSCPEFKQYKKFYDDGTIKINAKLCQPDGSGLDTPDDVAEEISNLEMFDEILLEQGLVAEVAQNRENLIRRQLANILTEGDALTKIDLFKMVSSELEQLEEGFTKNCAMFVSLANLGMYNLSGVSGQGAIGKEQVVIQNENEYHVNAQALIFPLLIHEIVKGLWDLSFFDLASDDQLPAEHIGQELRNMTSGPAFNSRLRQLIPDKYFAKYDDFITYFRHYVLKQMDVDDIKLLLNGDRKVLQDAINNTMKTIEQFEESAIMKFNRVFRVLLEKYLITEAFEDQKLPQIIKLLKAKKYSEDDINDIIPLIRSADPTVDGKYTLVITMWLLKEKETRDVNQQWANDVRHCLEVFFRIKDNSEFRGDKNIANIKVYDTAEKLSDLINRNSELADRIEQRIRMKTAIKDSRDDEGKLNMEGIDKLNEVDSNGHHYELYHIKTSQAANVVLQKQSKVCYGLWCVKLESNFDNPTYGGGPNQGVYLVTRDGFYIALFDLNGMNLKWGAELPVERNLTMEEMNEIAPVVAPFLKSKMKEIEKKYNEL